MTPTETDRLIRRLIGGDPEAPATILRRAVSSTDSALLVAAALIDSPDSPDSADSTSPDLIGRAAELAGTTRDRQLVAIAAAYLAGDRDRLDALVRDHLADYPDNLLVAWIATGAGGSNRPSPHPSGEAMNRTLTAVLLIAAAVLANAAFAVLGMVFDYPDVLKEPVEEILADFRASQTAVIVGFAVLAVSAALMAPVAIGVGRLAANRTMRVAVPVGIAAAVVQVIGLSRWPLLVPGFAAAASSADPQLATAARDAFVLAHRVLGNLIGETFGYLLTAAWTLLVVAALGRSIAGRWFAALGAVSAVLVLSGVLSPFGLPVIDTANFIGYVLWSLWLVIFGILLLRRPSTSAAPASAGASPAQDRLADR